ncbi:MAG: hypothetical protein RLZZ517_59 [Candidatus Parcubacteria bacterium]|jgi:hypothetical protein
MIASILDLFVVALDFLVYLIPIAVPLALMYFLFHVYIDYNRAKYYNSLEWVLLEIIPPQEHMRSPAAMELFLLALYQTGGESTWIDRWVKGKVRTWFTLEIVSIEGRVHFYLNCEKKLQKYIESQIYAQYPGSEIRVSEDYAAKFNQEQYDMVAVEVQLTKPDPWPIKTYIDYQLEKGDQEEDSKIDPITPLLEFLTTVKENNYICLQIIVRAHKPEDPDPTKLFPSFSKKVDNWKDAAKSEIKKIKEESFMEFDEGDRKRKQNVQTEAQKRAIIALERSVTKFSFDTGIRMLNIGKKGSYENMLGLMNGMLKQFNSPELNSFKPLMITSFDYPWQDPLGRRIKKMKAEMLEAYQLRDYFWKSNYKKESRKYFVLNTEELATIYHFPGKVAQTPTLSRVDSRKETPPDNLPI